MILFHNVVLVLTLAQPASSADGSNGLEIRHSTCIGWVLIHIDHSRQRVAIVPQSTTEESFGGCRIAPISQQEIDGLSCRIDGSIQETLSSLDVDVRLIQPPASVCPSQVRTAALIYFRTVYLHPTPNAAGRNCQSALRCHLRHVNQRNLVPQIPSHAPQNNVTAIVPPLEWIRRCKWATSTLSARQDFATEPQLLRKSGQLFSPPEIFQKKLEPMIRLVHASLHQSRLSHARGQPKNVVDIWKKVSILGVFRPTLSIFSTFAFSRTSYTRRH